MQKNIKLNPKVLDKISNSGKVGDEEKLDFMKYLSYLTPSEQQELVGLL